MLTSPGQAGGAMTLTETGQILGIYSGIGLPKDAEG